MSRAASAQKAAATAAKVVQDAVATGSCFAVTDARWGRAEVLVEMLRATGPARVTLASWTIGKVQADLLHRLVVDGSIVELRILMDPSHRAKCDGRLAKVQTLKAQIVWAKSHSKFTAVRGATLALSEHGLMNFNRAVRGENIDVSADPARVETMEASWEAAWAAQGGSCAPDSADPVAAMKAMTRQPTAAPGEDATEMEPEDAWLSEAVQERRLAGIVNGLPERWRRSFVLHVIEGQRRSVVLERLGVRRATFSTWRLQPAWRTAAKEAHDILALLRVQDARLMVRMADEAVMGVLGDEGAEAKDRLKAAEMVYDRSGQPKGSTLPGLVEAGEARPASDQGGLLVALAKLRAHHEARMAQGDPKAAEQFLEVLRMEARILGLEAPQKVEIRSLARGLTDAELDVEEARLATIEADIGR